MKIWQGAAGVCVNGKNELLMVLQAAPGEDQKWTIPSGGKEKMETFEECCVREIFEETGYTTKIQSFLHTKETTLDDIDVLVHYYTVKCTGGSAVIQDPDELIYDIAWKSADEIVQLSLAFPEDREFYLQMLQRKIKPGTDVALQK
ncbi:NUDIX hydrolase [Jeotgalibacillus sp. R-1-5s-1]|uniref:NUDIX hydrolase n=1 Tax=Jeotgalibacillus sp. R-1-5s-1 TaxID=2555897 RepID=UPI001069227F|nr:NUDIX hydrolase [Jeotgalibacillus sp. R-1-5s-1]TFE00878.1 NUDIX hydrolase [Jeotgalibacillus sp. R-1-5s-1]